MAFIQSHFSQRVGGAALGFVGAYLILMGLGGWNGDLETSGAVYWGPGLAVLALGVYIFVLFQRKSDAARRAYYEDRRRARAQRNSAPPTPTPAPTPPDPQDTPANR
ncbi:MAG: hypothetical protein ACYTGQ_03330 [Planctomycetota bacterium]|jgi:hypothetical protein